MRERRGRNTVLSLRRERRVGWLSLRRVLGLSYGSDRVPRVLMVRWGWGTRKSGGVWEGGRGSILRYFLREARS